MESKEVINPSMWIMLAALVVLGGYYIALEWLASSQEKYLGISSPTSLASEDQPRNALVSEQPPAPPHKP